MDLIHDSTSKSWIDTHKINVREFLNRFESDSEFQKENELNEDNVLDSLLFDLDLNSTQVFKLTKDCLISKLDTNEEKDFSYYYRSKLDELNSQYEGLKTLNARRNNYRLFKNNSLYRFRVLNRQKYRTNYITFNLKENLLNKSDEDRINKIESLLTVQIFNPIISNNYKELRHNNFIMHEYHVLGCQPLTKLKDIYQCVSDLMSPIDCSQNPDISNSLNKAEDYTSSFLFIDNCFYVDTRQSTNIDYSEVIREWASNPDRQIGPFDNKIMQETKFEDLNIQLGYPYLYMHQGNCEHLLVFSDLRIHNRKKDFKYYSSYPCRVATINRYKSKCNMCELNASKWIVYENQRLPHSPFFFCENCFKCFNYNEKGEMIGIFKAYPYIYSSYNV